jgi:hypothetical protein
MYSGCVFDFATSFLSSGWKVNSSLTTAAAMQTGNLLSLLLLAAAACSAHAQFGPAGFETVSGTSVYR